jgi:3-methylfumaryl-CoA hydratase
MIFIALRSSKLATTVPPRDHSEGALQCRRDDVNIDDLRQWVGTEQKSDDVLTPVPAAALAATLDYEPQQPNAGDPLPPLWHWLYFLPLYPISRSGPDGHSARGEFLPPVPLPRRMWAGSRFEFQHPLRIGATVSRVSRIADVSAKQGRSGPLVFVAVRHTISDADGIALTEEHDIVYRENAAPGASPAPPQLAEVNAEWSREIEPSPVLLFRYSALTFNSHRIHYDRRYVTETEGYPGLVVHGPLIATLLLDLLRRNLTEATVTRFSFRAVRPLYDNAPFTVCGMPDADAKIVRLWAKDVDGWLAMDATATLARY